MPRPPRLDRAGGGPLTDLIGFAALATVLLSQQAFKVASLPATADPPGE